MMFKSLLEHVLGMEEEMKTKICMFSNKLQFHKITLSCQKVIIWCFCMPILTHTLSYYVILQIADDHYIQLV